MILPHQVIAQAKIVNHELPQLRIILFLTVLQLSHALSGNQKCHLIVVREMMDFKITGYPAPGANLEFEICKGIADLLRLSGRLIIISIFFQIDNSFNNHFHRIFLEVSPIYSDFLPREPPLQSK
jgi:hypothetical protein